MIVKATEDCNIVPTNGTFSDEANDTTLKVVVNVIDVNDNPPKFVSKIFTGGVTTEADFGTQFMQVKARFYRFYTHLSPLLNATNIAKRKFFFFFCSRRPTWTRVIMPRSVIIRLAKCT